MRVGDTALSANARTVVSSAGRNDGFVAELTTSGAVRWLVRVGGSGADSVQGVAARGDRVAIAGVFTAGAELLGEPLVAFDEKLPFADGFVAELDASGARRWQQTFGGKLDDAVAGVAIDSKNRVIVAATVRDSIRIGGRDLATRGPADGLVAWFSPAGDPGSSTIIGGSEFDGLRAIAAIDDRVVVAGFSRSASALSMREAAPTASSSTSTPPASSRPAGTPPVQAAKRSQPSRVCPAASSRASRTPRH